MVSELVIGDPTWPYTKAKTAVLIAAAAAIREDGPRAATLKNIASRAGITEPAIFRHFEGIDGLFNGLFTMVERMYDRFSACYPEDAVGLARFRAAMLGSIGVFADSKDFAYVIMHAEQVFRGYPDLKRRLDELKRRDEAKALAALEEARERREIRRDVEIDSIATAVIGMLHMTIVFWLDSGFAFDLREAGAKRWSDAERLMEMPPPCTDN
ncbi:MAG: TetR/AcrR family transcriptional regulator [Spirochaetaceae bacterium]|nr:TetR/AcrR family transcriptional regulator [Spirochaetaceae bacterium]